MSNSAVAMLSRRSLLLAVLSAYLLVLMEWVFHVTKPSFLSVLLPGEALSVLLIAPLPLVAVAMAVAALSLPLMFVGQRLGARGAHVAWVAAALPAAFLAPLLLLLVDNFTYTTSGWGITTLRSGSRLAYGVAFCITALWIVRTLAGKLLERGPSRREGIAAGLLVLVSALALAFTIWIGETSHVSWGEQREGAQLTDVLLISGDAFDVTDIPRYGHRTMGLFRLLGENTVAFENHFPNANRTAATVPAALTGKYATTTGKISGTTFFSGHDAYEHLPGLLRAYGYRSIQIGDKHQVDSAHWGMQGAFDVYNDTPVGRDLLSPFFARLGLSLGPWGSLGSSGYLVSELRLPRVVASRIVERLRHISGGELMVQPHRVSHRGRGRIESDAMAASLLRFLDTNPGPVFVQLHSMLTRGVNGLPKFQDLMKQILRELHRQGRLRDAMIVVWSDHGKQHSQNLRLPLIVKFPAGFEVASRMASRSTRVVGSVSRRTPDTRANTQTVDIAPTILEVLGIPIPDWMEGRSLLESLDPHEPIFSTFEGLGGKGLKRDTERGRVRSALRKVGLIVCQRWYALHVWKHADFTSGLIDRHTAPCAADRLPDEGEARGMMLEHLQARGYGAGLSGVTGLLGRTEGSSP